MNKKDIVAYGSSLYRVLSVKDGKTLVIDCLQPKMPYWAELGSGEIRCSDEHELYEKTCELCKQTQEIIKSMEDLL